MNSSSPAPEISATQGRLCIALAAVLWSTSGGFTRLLGPNTPFASLLPPVPALQMAFFRVLWAGLVLVPLLWRGDLGFRLPMIPMGLSFALMNGLFIAAMAGGSVANAILLQYTAPMWMYLFCVGVLREPADRRGGVALLIGLAGIGVIIAGGWAGGQLDVILMALGSGVTYAGVLIGLRVLRGLSSSWLTVWNHVIGALALLPWVWLLPLPTAPQMVVLVVYGAFQMGLPYWLVARGLRSVSPQEAGTLTLLEPLLNPLWAWLVFRDEPFHWTTVAGGVFILGALAYRYWPVGATKQVENRSESAEAPDR
jgi:drug/metabolite transporter (DMT)-like permease